MFPSKNFLAAMKAHVKSVLPRNKRTKTIVATGIEPSKSKTVVILSRGAAEHVEYANFNAVIPCKSALKDSSKYTTTATIHPALRDKRAKKVQWADHVNNNYTAAPYNFGNRLTTTFTVDRTPEVHIDRLTRENIEDENSKSSTPEPPCHGHCKTKSSASFTTEQLPLLEGLSLTKSIFVEFGFKKSKGKGRFELKAVREVPKSEGNGRIFNSCSFTP